MSLIAASEERKERLELLQRAKRKRDEVSNASGSADTTEITEIMQYRNYDPDSHGPKLGFLHNPVQAGVETIESRARMIQTDTIRGNVASDTKMTAYEAQDLQTKGAHWDLKREILSKLEQLKPQQDAVIAKYVRSKILSSKESRTQ